MNKRIIIPVAIATAFFLNSPFAGAQSSGKKSITKDETVVIRKDKSNGKTVIEIKDGTVYVNGEAIVTVHDADAAKVHKKVIIENGGANGAQSFSFHNDGDGRSEREYMDEGEGGDGPARSGQKRAMLGVMTDPKSNVIGAMVKSVQPGSAAEEAGLKEGDVITRVDGKTIKDAPQLVSEIMAQHEPGERVTINYERGGEERSTTAKLGSATPQVSMRQFRFGPEGGEGNMPGDMPNSFFHSLPFSMDGAESMTPAPKLGVSAEDRADGEGVRVLSVKPGSPASGAGLKEGDVITRLSGDKIASVDELQNALRSSKPGERLKLSYNRGAKAMTAEVVIPKTMKKAEL